MEDGYSGYIFGVVDIYGGCRGCNPRALRANSVRF